MVGTELERVDKTYRRLGRRWAWNILSIAGFQGRESNIRKRAVSKLELQPGDTVLDVACGRGSNFPHLQAAIGGSGRIVGLDYSPTMLAGADDLVRERGWANVTLVRSDAAEMNYAGEFDGAICTIAMSVIPGWQEALRSMVRAVRPGKRVVVLDGQLGTGLKRLGNPFARLFACIVAADLSRDIPGECSRALANVREETLLFGTYYIVSGEAARV